jgi:hypothetical protein
VHPDICCDLCAQVGALGPLGEVILLTASLVLAAWKSWHAHQLTRANAAIKEEATQAKVEAASARGQVVILESLRPPP